MKHEAASRNAERHKLLSQRVREYGRVPWIIGGDWNQPTDVPRFSGINPTIVSSGEPAFDNKTCIDWFAVSNGLGRVVGTKVYHDSTTTDTNQWNGNPEDPRRTAGVQTGHA